MAFGVGVVDGLAEVGLTVTEGPMLGTSGGAWAAATAAHGLRLADVVEATATGKRSGVPQTEITRGLFGDTRNHRLGATVVDRRTGRLRVLRADKHRVADVVGASSSAPGLFPPYPIGKRRYIDGGIYTPTAASLAASARLLVVVAPMGAAVLGPVGRFYERLLDAEERLWRLRTGGKVLRIAPDRRFAADVGRGVQCLLDPDRTSLVYERARDLAAERARQQPSVGAVVAVAS
jgi:predicted acylesterase/phospholipase RssA